MRASAVVPTGVERRVGAEEIIVTKTDPRGVVKYANDVFLRISAYAPRDVIGKPHNVIRHPDMPRCVFKLLWDTLKAEREVFAYIVNLAADGAHYWVFAHVTPSFGDDGEVVGYHSNRRAPDWNAVARVTELYAALRAEESRHDDPGDGLAASSALLTATLAERGQTYDEYVWSLTDAVAVAA